MAEITLNHITKIEGHARLDLKVEEGKLVECKLGSIEGSRHFQALLKGRRWDDAPEITSRICGICSSAHGVVAVIAMERALGIQASEQTIMLRDFQTLGERIRSHAAHLYVLALPDYLGYESVIAMAGKFKEEIARALRIIKLGNDMLTAVTGRVMHQVSNQVGGFGHYPTQKQIDDFRQKLIDAKDDIFKTAELFASLEYPEFETDGEMFSLTKEDCYAMSYGDVKIGDKIFHQDKYLDVIKEYHEPYSNANFVVKEGKGYFVGSLARINNNFDRLSPATKEFCKKIGWKVPEKNTFKNNLAQAIELIHHWETGIELLGKLKIKHEEMVKPLLKPGNGIAANEAPRGTLWHEYKVDDKGIITFGNVIAPTTQVLRNMQDDIAKFTQMMLDNGKSKEEIVPGIEKLIRACDPCFSCATHFLKVNWL